MDRMTLEDFYNDPEFYRRANQAAQRERARMIREGLGWIWERAAALLTPRIHVRPTGWIERLG